MLPVSYNNVSKETKAVGQRLMAHARSFLKKSGKSDDETRTILEGIEEDARADTFQWALDEFDHYVEPVSAEHYVQWFAEMVWKRLTGNEHGPLPYKFTAGVSGSPYAIEVLESAGTTEEEILQFMDKLDNNLEEEPNMALHTVPAFVKTKTSPPGTRDAPAEPTNPLAQRVKAEPQYPDNTSILGKRKNDEPEATAPKYGRGNDGQRVTPGSRNTNRTYEPWGAPLSAKDHQLMNIGLMTNIWTNRISPRHMSDYGGGLFEVRIPSGKAWTLLGKDIRRAFRLISSEWRPIRLHTRESGAFMCVGLWVKTGQTQGQKAEVMRHTLPELYRLLRRWSLQAQGSGQAESLADFLTDYLGA